jgi:osmotically-inducible protein OsmY
MTQKPFARAQRIPGSPPPTRKVFVGNQRLEDNLVECVKVAIWNAIGEPSHGVDVTVTGNSARLKGTVTTEAQRHAAAAAARRLPWIATVDNKLQVGPPSILNDGPTPLDADQHRMTCA